MRDILQESTKELKIRDTKIKRFQPSQMPQLMQLERSSFLIDAYSEERMWGLCKRFPETFLIAEKDGQLIGYIVGAIEGEVGEIDTMAVESNFRRQGIGERLLQGILAIFKDKGLKRVQLCVRPDNKPAISLYKKFGFEEVGKIKNYYKDGSDAIRMRLNK